ncbi:PRC and DUF2382 domain-containing protein [Nonomuraea sp. MCN248]|uniref:PRC and DUF2382 domain-containing protein n=1 Tax=Nonomuraea corallina TaxID=2989783 RepID=A0ABT4SGQ6_9ACTN|nr:PRC and DUF2382 domain-containing protein [Nonomuraea corallina]MDA0636155.1 PRC and DUF2382 domain-containing protein [Nonomuraea corallina]
MQTEIRSLFECDVIGSDGQHVGKVGQVYLSDRTGKPEWVTVRTGMFGMKQSFVPLIGARRTGDELRVAFDKETIKGAPNIDADDRLTLEEEAGLYRYYGMQPSDIPAQRSPESGTGTSTADTTTESTTTGSATTGSTTTGSAATGAAAGSEQLNREQDSVSQDSVSKDRGSQSHEPRGFAPGSPGTRGSEPQSRESLNREPLSSQARGGESLSRETRDLRGEGVSDIDMTRSEERMHVGKERREAGHVRLRKYVETEDVQERVPLEHDEVVIEREPITGGTPQEGRELAEDEESITLYEERPVISKEATPVERVRMHKEHVRSEETVTGTVRKERFEVDRDGTTIEEQAGDRPEGSQGPGRS